MAKRAVKKPSTPSSLVVGLMGALQESKQGWHMARRRKPCQCLTGCMVFSVVLTGTLATGSIACPKCFPQGKSVPAQDSVSLPISSGRQLAACHDVLKWEIFDKWVFSGIIKQAAASGFNTWIMNYCDHFVKRFVDNQICLFLFMCMCVKLCVYTYWIFQPINSLSMSIFYIDTCD